MSKGDTVQYTTPDGLRRGFYLGRLHTGRCVVAHRLADGWEPKVVDDARLYASCGGVMPYDAPAWVRTWKGN